MRRKESDKRTERVGRMQERENKRERVREKNFFLAWDALSTRDGKPFHKLSKWFPFTHLEDE